MDDWPSVANAINARMVELRLTQRELSEMSGVSLSTVRELQQGRSGRQRSNKTLASISQALEWAPDHLHRIVRGDNPAAPEPVDVGVQVRVLAELEAIRKHLAHIDERIDDLTRPGDSDTPR